MFCTRSLIYIKSIMQSCERKVTTLSRIHPLGLIANVSGRVSMIACVTTRIRAFLCGSHSLGKSANRL